MAGHDAASQSVEVAIRILVVDDSPRVRQGVRELLLLHGFEVVDTVADGERRR